MSGFQSARNVEARGLQVLLPYLKEKSDGALVVTNKGNLAKYLQLQIGDVIYNDADEVLWTAEIKVEQKFTGNLFLETWSNRNLQDRASHSMRGQNRGWLEHLRSDLLLYYFLNTDDLYTIDLFALKRWAFGFTHSDGTDYPAHLENYPERPQRRYAQMNDTHGRLVPISDLQTVLRRKFRHCKVRQISLLEDAA